MNENKMYYLNTGVRPDMGNESLGLTHPFYHDLRSRGAGIATWNGNASANEANVGTGNDFNGWPWYRGVKAAYGSVIDSTSGHRWTEPNPTQMYWRPDKVILEYLLENPYIPHRTGGWSQGNPTGLTRLSVDYPSEQASVSAKV